MNILISNASSKPIYEQICAQLKTSILSGELAQGEALPSIRALARELRISVITTKRAYDELEREGYVCTVAGKGSYVAETSVGLLREERLRELEELLRRCLALAPGCGLDEAGLHELLALLAQEDENGRTPNSQEELR